jgi:hypothetical protein
MAFLMDVLVLVLGIVLHWIVSEILAMTKYVW